MCSEQLQLTTSFAYGEGVPNRDLGAVNLSSLSLLATLYSTGTETGTVAQAPLDLLGLAVAALFAGPHHSFATGKHLR